MPGLQPETFDAFLKEACHVARHSLPQMLTVLECADHRTNLTISDARLAIVQAALVPDQPPSHEAAFVRCLLLDGGDASSVCPSVS